jgi:oligoribonuclease
MTGLDVENDVIIEIFCIITNGNLEIVAEEGWGAVIHQSKERMDQMVGFSSHVKVIEAGLTSD